MTVVHASPWLVTILRCNAENMQVGITADWRSPKWGMNSKSGQNLQNWAGSLHPKTFTIGSDFSQLLLPYISK